MDDRGLYVAALIDSGVRSYATGAVLRQRERSRDAAEELPGSFADGVEDTVVRLRYLVEAVAAERPTLFLSYVDWLRDAYRARGAPLASLEASLRCLGDELEEALPEDARALARAPLSAALQRLGEPSPVPDAEALAPGAPHGDLARRLLLALLEARRGEALRLAGEALDGGCSVADLHEHVVLKVLAEIGRMWQTGEVHVGEEHLASRVVEEVLALARARIPPAPEGARRVVAATVPGDLHDIGARIVSDRFALAGWEAIFLGASVPASDLALALRDFRADLAVVSASLGLYVRATAELVRDLRTALGDAAVPILVGGAPFTEIEDLWRVVGADGCASDSAAAVARGEELTSGP